MQPIFGTDERAVNLFRATISAPRFNKYMSAVGNDLFRAIDLYHWNSLLAQSLFIPLQVWEIALRNKLNGFMCWKFGNDWPYDEKRALRTLQGQDKRKIREAIQRQRKDRGIENPTTDMIVADLSIGFWVSLLAAKYEFPLVWKYNLSRVFPDEPGLTRAIAGPKSDRIRILRNRVAHHEPIFHLPLDDRYDELLGLLGGLCSASRMYADRVSNFPDVWKSPP